MSTRLAEVLESLTYLPELVVFDLDCTLWHPWIDSMHGGPFTAHPSDPKVILDRTQRPLTLYHDVPAILKTFHQYGIKIGIASRTPGIEWAFEALEVYMLEDGNGERVPMKMAHFSELKQKLTRTTSMLFFDDESRNIKCNCWQSRVTSILVSGVSISSIVEGLQKHQERDRQGT
ncbi:magnesium-dependent phosphatase-1 [Chytridium lagenaria]|nr:magnesium-dependent phosphatase-1 [Chytridium lagenaria]